MRCPEMRTERFERGRGCETGTLGRQGGREGFARTQLQGLHSHVPLDSGEAAGLGNMWEKEGPPLRAGSNCNSL